jgi:hypothetical protein
MIGYWEKQPNRKPEMAALLRDYRNRGRSQVGIMRRQDATSAPVELESRPVQPARLHELTESLRSLADEERVARERKKPRDIVGKRGAWRMVPRPQQPPSDDS